MTPLSHNLKSHSELSIGAGHAVDENGCWIWQGRKDPAGYGLLTRQRVTQRAHRVYFAAAYGEDALPTGWAVHHVCEVKSCVNPDHLEAMPLHVHMWHHQVERKRTLTDDERGEIRRLAEDPRRPIREIAAQFGISQSYAEYIANGQRYNERGEPALTYPRVCPGCGTEFEGRRRQARFCSKRCRVNFNSRQRRARAKNVA